MLSGRSAACRARSRDRADSSFGWLNDHTVQHHLFGSMPPPALMLRWPKRAAPALLPAGSTPPRFCAPPSAPWAPARRPAGPPRRRRRSRWPAAWRGATRMRSPTTRSWVVRPLLAACASPRAWTGACCCRRVAVACPDAPVLRGWVWFCLFLARFPCSSVSQFQKSALLLLGLSSRACSDAGCG